MTVLRKYGVATTILFPLIDAGAQDFESTPVTFAAGDTKISKDEGAAANTTNNPAHEGNGIYSLALTATEMQAARIVVTVIDSATKAWEDQAIIIDTYGNASAQHAFDLDDAQPTVDLAADAITAAAVSTAGAHEIADEILKRGLSSVEPSPGARTVYAALASLVNRVRINGANLEIYETNDSTIIATIPITTSATQAPITELDPP